MYTLTDLLGPFDENGRMYTEGQLLEMFKWIGVRAMGIPRFGTHIIRTNHATAVAMYCVRNGLPQDHQTVKDLFALGRHGDGVRIKSHSQVKANTPDAGSIKTILMVTVSSLVSLEKGVDAVIICEVDWMTLLWMTWWRWVVRGSWRSRISLMIHCANSRAWVAC